MTCAAPIVLDGWDRITEGIEADWRRPRAGFAHESPARCCGAPSASTTTAACYHRAMTEDLSKLLTQSLPALEVRRALFDDLAIGRAWVGLTKAEPKLTLTTSKGLAIEVERRPTGPMKLEYTVAVAGVEERVGRFYCQTPMAGRVQVTNANVYEIDGVDYRRQGIGLAVYDLIARDVSAAGGQGVEPHWGSMSDAAIAFWEGRRPEWKGKLKALNRLGVMASGLFE